MTEENVEEDNLSVFEKAMSSIERGREGLNKGIPIPFERLRRYLPNIQQKTYYLVGAGTKVGKTSLADDIFFYGAYDHIVANPSEITLDIDYFSFEIDSETKILKGINRKLWHDYGLIVDASTILSRGEHKCSQEIYDLAKTYRGYFDKMEDMVTVHDMPDNPTGINKYLINKARQHGRIIEKNIQKDPTKDPVMRFDKYIPNDPNRYWIIMIDHIALMLEERGYNTKQNIDKMSQYLVQLRNNFNAIPVVIQQLAFDSESDQRHQAGRLTPTLKDFGDSKYTTRDANVIMTLFSPSRYNIERFQNYNINRLSNTYRNLEILENRDGEPNVNVGLNFIGECGTFRELPKAGEMTEAGYDYAVNKLNNKSDYVKNKEGIWMRREM